MGTVERRDRGFVPSKRRQPGEDRRSLGGVAGGGGAGGRAVGAGGKSPGLWERVRDRYPRMQPLFARGAALTLALSLSSMALAILLGVTLALGRTFGPRPVQWLCTLYVEFVRGTPLLVQLIMIYFGLPELGLKL